MLKSASRICDKLQEHSYYSRPGTLFELVILLSGSGVVFPTRLLLYRAVKTVAVPDTQMEYSHIRKQAQMGRCASLPSLPGHTR